MAKNEIKPTAEQLSDPYVLQLIEALAKRDDEIERLRADCKDKQRLIETQKQYLDNRDSVIKGMNEMIKELEAKLAAIYDKWPEFKGGEDEN